MRKYPSKEHVAELARRSVLQAMSPKGESQTGSQKSGPGEWFTKDCLGNVMFHAQKAGRHAQTAQLVGLGSEQDNETAIQHLQKVITRAAMQIWVMVDSSSHLRFPKQEEIDLEGRALLLGLQEKH